MLSSDGSFQWPSVAKGSLWTKMVHAQMQNDKLLETFRGITWFPLVIWKSNLREWGSIDSTDIK